MPCRVAAAEALATGSRWVIEFHFDRQRVLLFATPSALRHAIDLAFGIHDPHFLVPVLPTAIRRRA